MTNFSPRTTERMKNKTTVRKANSPLEKNVSVGESAGAKKRHLLVLTLLTATVAPLQCSIRNNRSRRWTPSTHCYHFHPCLQFLSFSSLLLVFLLQAFHKTPRRLIKCMNLSTELAALISPNLWDFDIHISSNYIINILLIYSFNPADLSSPETLKDSSTISDARHPPRISN